MNAADFWSAVSIAGGCLFFLAGSIGMLRLPDVYTRLHAATKADNVGLGLIILGLLPQTESIWEVAKFLLIWVVLLASSSTACHLIARAAWRRGVSPWRKS